MAASAIWYQPQRGIEHPGEHHCIDTPALPVFEPESCRGPFHRIPISGGRGVKPVSILTDNQVHIRFGYCLSIPAARLTAERADEHVAIVDDDPDDRFLRLVAVPSLDEDLFGGGDLIELFW